MRTSCVGLTGLLACVLITRSEPFPLRKVTQKSEPAAWKPLTYKDKTTKVVYYVESDGQHVSAIDEDGRIIWHTEPLEKIRDRERSGRKWPRITKIGKPSDLVPRGMVESLEGKKRPFVGVGSGRSKGVLDRDGEFAIWSTDL